MTKLFISFAGTLAALASGRVTVEDLNGGLFVFGCTREHALDPGGNGEYIEQIVLDDIGRWAQLADAVKRAEQEGRVRWRRREQGNASFELVDELLVANGYKKLMTHEQAYGDDSFVIGTDYCYSSVEKRSTEIEVIWQAKPRRSMTAAVTYGKSPTRSRR